MSIFPIVNIRIRRNRLFVNARKIFTDLSNYKDSEDYFTHARFMSLIQGE